jgi:hypothetical protein
LSRVIEWQHHVSVRVPRSHPIREALVSLREPVQHRLNAQRGIERRVRAQGFQFGAQRVHAACGPVFIAKMRVGVPVVHDLSAFLIVLQPFLDQAHPSGKRDIVRRRARLVPRRQLRRAGAYARGGEPRREREHLVDPHLVRKRQPPARTGLVHCADGHLFPELKPFTGRRVRGTWRLIPRGGVARIRAAKLRECRPHRRVG